jgi:hypothetical protein
MKALTEIEAWKDIREAFQSYSDYGSTCRRSLNGLCWAVSSLVDEGKISLVKGRRMSRRIKSVKPAGVSGNVYFWDCTPFGAANRVRAVNKILREIRREASVINPSKNK